jgi:anti-sigma B factor antagonist
MLMDSTTQGGVTVLTPNIVRLDAAVATSFKDAASAALASQPPRAIIDLHTVDFIDSSGLGALVSVLKSLGAGAQLALVGLAPQACTIFKLTRMDKIFVLHATVDQAVAALSN